MVRSTMSIMGLYNYDNSIFDRFVVPAGINKDTLLENILIDLEGLEVVYTNPMTMKVAIGSWSKTRVDSWERMLKALEAEYNAIHNFDRNEDYTDAIKEKSKTDGSSTGTSNGESDRFVSGYNSSDGLTQSQKMTGKDNSTNSMTDTTESDKNIQHNAHLYGNIGVMTTQAMINEELELRKTDIYHQIETEFKEKFCLLIY